MSDLEIVAYCVFTGFQLFIPRALDTEGASWESDESWRTIVDLPAFERVAAEFDLSYNSR